MRNRLIRGAPSDSRRPSVAARAAVLLAALTALSAVVDGRAPGAGFPGMPAPATLAAGHGVTGAEFVYTVVAGDSLSRVGAKFGVNFRDIAALNGLPHNARLRIGQRLHIDNRHVVPGGVDDGLLLNIPQRMLFLFRDGRLVHAYPVAVGRSAAKWQTPVRAFRISEKDVNPTWVVPPGIQDEMRADGREVEDQVPPGPDNPLGAYRLRLADTDWAIHGTNRPQSVYTFETHGCVRLGPDDIRDLFGRVRVGDPVLFVYAPVLMAIGADDAVFLEAEPDVYNTGLDFAATAGRAAEALGVASRLDPARVQQVLAMGAGIARRVDERHSPEHEQGVPAVSLRDCGVGYYPRSDFVHVDVGRVRCR